jgi:hypothetical protein
MVNMASYTQSQPQNGLYESVPQQTETRGYGNASQHDFAHGKLRQAAVRSLILT